MPAAHGTIIYYEAVGADTGMNVGYAYRILNSNLFMPYGRKIVKAWLKITENQGSGNETSG